MTSKQINIAIAEVCGTKKWSSRNLPPPAMLLDVPDYVNDLNSMHEAERFLHDYVDLNEDVWGNYLSWLGYCGENNTSEVFQCVHATARQRAEAFLRTIGKWEGDK